MKLPIELAFGVKTQMYRSGDPDAALADSDFKGMRERVINRDEWRCQACGCPSSPAEGKPSGGFEVHHRDNNHHNNDISNLVTLCPLCHGIFHIGWTARQRSGHFIWLPEISQANLNLFIHFYALARLHAREILPTAVKASEMNPEQTAANEVEGRLDDAWGIMVQQRIPDGLLLDPDTKADMGGKLSDDRTLFGSMLASMARSVSDADFARLGKALYGLRYLYEPEADREAGVYALCKAWQPGARQAQNWLAAATAVLGVNAGKNTNPGNSARDVD